MKKIINCQKNYSLLAEEQTILTALNNPLIIKLIAKFVDDWYCYFVIEYCDVNMIITINFCVNKFCPAMF